MIPRLPLTALLLAATLLTGCSPYVLCGKIIEGPEAGAYNVAKDDPRIESIGLPDSTIDITLDPDSLGRQHLGQFITDSTGRFAIPLDVLGAGFLENEFEILVRRPGYQYVQQTIMLPSASQFLLIRMQRGPDTYRPPDDPFQGVQPYLNR